MTQEQFQALYKEYKGKIQDKALNDDLENLYSIAHDSDVMLVTVVGNLKAGKSTFINCLVHKDISDIRDEECTKRPLFIYNSKSETYKTYVKREDAGTLEINKVLKSFFDPKKNDVSNQFSVEERSLAVVKEKQNAYDFLFTSCGFDLKIDGIKGKQIVFVDMPGSDGIEANQNYDRFYDLILQRTDLVILVWSSDNPLSLSLKEYIEKIRNSNVDVPFVVAFNNKDAKGDFVDEPDTNEKNFGVWKKMLETTAKAKIDEETSSILNVYHVLEAMMGKKAKSEAEEKVQKSLDDFKAFENKLSAKYFSDGNIKDSLRTNQKTRFQNQIANFRNAMETKIAELKEEIEKFNASVKLVTPVTGTKESITEFLNGFTTQVALDNSSEMGECAKSLPDTSWFWKSDIVDILKDKYVPLHLKGDLSGKFAYYVEGFVSELTTRIDASEWKGMVSFDNKKYEYTLPDDIPFKKCIKKFRLFSYKRNDLENAMKELKKHLLNYGSMGIQIMNVCDEIKQKYFGEIKEKEHISEKENLLMTLEAILNRL